MQILASFDPSGTLINKTIKITKILPYMLKLAGVPSEFINSEQETLEQEQTMAINERNAELQNMQDNLAMNNLIEQGKEDAKKNL